MRRSRSSRFHGVARRPSVLDRIAFRLDQKEIQPESVNPI